MLLRWTAAAFAAIALAGLLTRLAPGTFPIGAGFLPERIAFPLTYWNAMGIACALVRAVRVHLSASGREPRLVPRRRGGAAVPIAVVTLYLTFSRGAIWVLPVGFVLYVLLRAAARAGDGGARGAIPAAIAVKVAYGAELLARADYDTAAAAPEARRVGLTSSRAASPRRRCARRAAAGRRAAGAGRARRARARLGFVAGVRARGAGRRRARRRARRGGSPTPRHVPRGPVPDVDDLRDRLTSAVDNGRIDNWRVALDGVRRGAAARHGRRDVPDHLGPRPPAAAGEGERRPLALPGDAVRAGRRRARAARGRARHGRWSAAALRLRRAGAARARRSSSRAG